MGRKEDGEEVGFSRFVNGDDSGRFPTRGEGVRVPGTVKKRKKEGAVQVQAGALVKGRQSGQGQTQWKRRDC